MIDELFDVRIEKGTPGFAIEDPIVNRLLPSRAAHLTAVREQAILSVVGVGIFAIEGGRRIRFQPDVEVRADAVSVWLHGVVTALLLAQRGRFALHASVVEIDGQAVAISGFRRAGKSTTALRLAQLGHLLVTDDVSPVVIGEPITVHPYTRPTYVFAETAAMLGLDVSKARPVLPDHPKLALEALRRNPVPLKAIVVLECSDRDAVDAKVVRGGPAHWLISANIYRADLLRELWWREMFAWAGEIAGQVPLHIVSRPRNDWTVDAVARAIEAIAVNGNQSAP